MMMTLAPTAPSTDSAGVAYRPASVVSRTTEPPNLLAGPGLPGAISSALYRLICALAWFSDRWLPGLAAAMRARIPGSPAPVPVPDCRSLVVMLMRSGLFLPLFDELAHPAVVARLSVEAEGPAAWSVRVGPRALAGAGLSSG